MLMAMFMADRRALMRTAAEALGVDFGQQVFVSPENYRMLSERYRSPRWPTLRRVLGRDAPP